MKLVLTIKWSGESLLVIVAFSFFVPGRLHTRLDLSAQECDADQSRTGPAILTDASPR